MGRTFARRSGSSQETQISLAECSATSPVSSSSSRSRSRADSSDGAQRRDCSTFRRSEGKGGGRQNHGAEGRRLARRTVSEPRLRWSDQRSSQEFAAKGDAVWQSFRSTSASYPDSSSTLGEGRKPRSSWEKSPCTWILDACVAVLLFLCGRKWTVNDHWSGDLESGSSSSSASQITRARKQLVTVTMLGTIDTVKVLIRYDATVRTTIQAALNAYALQERLPPGRGSCNPDAYQLHYSAFSLQSLDADELVQNLGARTFVLCPVTQQQQRPHADADHVLSHRSALSSSSSLLAN